VKSMKKMSGRKRRDRYGRFSTFGNSLTSRRQARAKLRKMPTLTRRKRSRGDLYAENGSLRASRKRVSLYRARREQRARRA